MYAPTCILTRKYHMTEVVFLIFRVYLEIKRLDTVGTVNQNIVPKKFSIGTLPTVIFLQ